MNVLDATKDFVIHHPFWSGVEPEYLDLVCNRAELRELEADQLIYTEGFEAEQFYLIQKGRVALEAFVPGMGNATIQELGTGEAFGSSAFFEPYRWRFTARTIEPTELVVLDALALREQAKTNPEFDRALLTRLTHLLVQRLRATRQQLIEFYGKYGVED